VLVTEDPGLRRVKPEHLRVGGGLLVDGPVYGHRGGEGSLADVPAAEESLLHRVLGREGLGEDGAEAVPGVLASGDEGGLSVGGIEIVSHIGSPFKVGGGRRLTPAERGFSRGTRGCTRRRCGRRRSSG